MSMMGFEDLPVRKTSTFFNIENDQMMVFKNDLIITDETPISSHQLSINQSNFNKNNVNLTGYNSVKNSRPLPSIASAVESQQNTLVALN